MGKPYQKHLCQGNKTIGFVKRNLNITNSNIKEKANIQK